MMRNVQILGVIWLGLGLLPVKAVDLAKAYDQGVAALESGDFEGGLALVDRVLEEEGENGLRRFGPAFGHFHYLKGMMLIRKGDFNGAIPSLRTSYEDFGNGNRKPGQAPNVFHIHSLMQWGMCLQASGKYAEAAEKLERTLVEDPKTSPPINRLSVEMNLGRCYMQIGREEEGQALLSKMLDLKGLPADAIQDAFTVLASEGVGMDVMATVRQNAEALVGSEEDRAVMNPRFAGLGAKALNEGNPLQALVWYNLMTSPAQALRERQARKAELEERKGRAVEAGRKDLVPRIEAVVAKLDTEIEEMRKLQEGALSGMAAAHYQLGSLSAAYAVYRQLERRYPEAGDRAQLVHNLVICATQLERWEEASSYGNMFESEFPNHPLRAGLRRILAETTSMQGNAGRALAMAEEARKGLAKGSAERESFDFLAAISKYQQNEFAEAATEFASFLEAYPESERRAAAAFHLGSCQVKLSQWEEAIPTLEAYVDGHQEDGNRSLGLYLLSLAHLISGDPSSALVRANHVLSQHSASPQVAGAHNVKGDAQAALGEKYEVVVASYLRGRAAAQKQGPGGFETGAYALKQLITTAAEAEEWDRATEHFQTFRELYEKSVWKMDAIVAVIPALVAKERKDEGKAILEALVRESGRNLDENFRSYTDFLRRHYEPGEQVASIRSLEGGGGVSPAIASWCKVGQIEVLERAEEPDEAGMGRLFEELNQLYQGAGDALSSYALVRLARWQGEVQRDEAAAMQIYDFILRERPSGEARGIAMVDTARLDFLSGDEGRRAEARSKFSDALNEFDEDQVRELAVLGLARIEAAEKRWREAQQRWEQYMASRSWNRARAEANFGYAQCLDSQHRTQEALKVYIAVYANFPHQLDYSSRAYLRAATILWDQGRNVDALKVLQDMLRRTKDKEHPGVAAAEKQFFQWREQYIKAQNP